MDDEVSRSLDVSIFETDDALDRIRFLDFFRYCDDTLDEMLGYLARRTPWIRPSDTGRSTNCLINQAGIWVHKRERGFHNYALPYSWDVRLGHKTRDAAVEELDDALDPSEVRRLLDAVGYAGRPPRESDDRLVAFYTADAPVPAGELRAFLGDLLPREAIPTSFVRLDDLPLAPSGKVDRDALPRPGSGLPVVEEAFRAPASALEVALASLWCEILGLETVGADDDFFELGGDSMHCIQIVSAARLKGWVFEPRDLFANPTISALAEVVSTQARGPASAASATTSELAELEAQFGGG